MALEEARKVMNQHDWAVNWGDLFVSSVSYNVTDDGHQCFIIDIEEASPDAGGFCDWIEAKMTEISPPYIKYVVQTGW